MTITLDTKVGEILKNTNAVEILEKYVPGVSKNPMLDMAREMSIKDLLQLPQAKELGITEELALKVLADVNARLEAAN